MRDQTQVLRSSEKHIRSRVAHNGTRRRRPGWRDDALDRRLVDRQRALHQRAVDPVDRHGDVRRVAAKGNAAQRQRESGRPADRADRVEVDRIEDDKLVVARARKIERFFSQPFFVAERFTGIEGRYVPLKDTVRGFREILDGKCDDLPEQAFMMAGTIEDVREKADRIAMGA